MEVARQANQTLLGTWAPVALGNPIQHQSSTVRAPISATT